MQKITIPIENPLITAAYKVNAYTNKFGYIHYGIDIADYELNRNIYSPGDGIIYDCGMDGKFYSDKRGNCIVMILKDVQFPSGEIKDLSARLFHLDNILVTKGQHVNQGDIIGIYGNSGANTTGSHLHIEFDTDINYPAHAIGIKESGNIIKKGNVDSTLDPSLIWFKKENQIIKTNEKIGTWVLENDINIPVLPSINYKEKYESVMKEKEILKNSIQNLYNMVESMGKDDLK